MSATPRQACVGGEVRALVYRTVSGTDDVYKGVKEAPLINLDEKPTLVAAAAAPLLRGLSCYKSWATYLALPRTVSAPYHRRVEASITSRCWQMDSSAS